MLEGCAGDRCTASPVKTAVRAGLVIALLVLGLLWLQRERASTLFPSGVEGGIAVQTSEELRRIRTAYEQQTSDVLVEASGRVIRLLEPDLRGARHQRFITELADGHTLLLSHNIDLASPVPLRVGDEVRFRGVYEWNPQGGVVHWTHADPGGEEAGGWILHRGVTYR